MSKNAYASSFSSIVTIKFWKALIFDLLFVLFAYIVIYFASSAVYTLTYDVVPALLEINLMMITEDATYEDSFIDLAPQIYSSMVKSILVLLVSYLVIIAAYTGLSQKSWSIAKNQKIKENKFMKMFLFNAAWFTIIIMVFLLLLLWNNFIISSIALYLFIIFAFTADYYLRSKIDFSSKNNSLKKIAISFFSNLHKILFSFTLSTATFILIWITIFYISNYYMWLGAFLFLITIFLYHGFFRGQILHISNQ